MGCRKHAVPATTFCLYEKDAALTASKEDFTKKLTNEKEKDYATLIGFAKSSAEQCHHFRLEQLHVLHCQ